MQDTVTIKEFSDHFGRILDRVQDNPNQTVCVTRNTQPWVMLKSPKKFTPDQLKMMEIHPGRIVRSKLHDFLGKAHYLKKPFVIARKGTPVGCVCPVDEH